MESSAQVRNRRFLAFFLQTYKYMRFVFYFIIAIAVCRPLCAEMSCIEALTGDHFESLEGSYTEVNNFKLGPEGSTDDVKAHYSTFKTSEKYKVGSVAHGLLAQTSWLTGYSFDQLVELIDAMPDVSSVSEDPVAAIIILQASLLGSSSVDDFLNYIQSFPEISGIRSGSLPFLVLVQTAYLTETNQGEFIEYVARFKRTNYQRGEVGFGVTIQTAFLAELENPQDINARFRYLTPYIIAPANKGFMSFAKQTEFFARRLHLKQ